MRTKHDINQIKIDSVDFKQPLGRYLILLFRAFEDDLMSSLNAIGFRDLVVSDLQIIRFVNPSTGSTSVEISKLAGITKQAVGKSIDSLVKRKYLRKNPSKTDARAKLVLFTSKGIKLLHATVNLVLKIEKKYIEVLGEAHFKEVKDKLALLINLHPMEDL